MKRNLLIALLAMLGAGSASALNPYAYGLNATVSDDAGSVEVSYNLNDAAESVTIAFLNGTNTVLTVDGTTDAGPNAVYVIASDLPKDTDLSWKVIVNGTVVASPVQHGDGKRFYHPAGVDVDVNPASPYFGRAYVTEAMLTSNSTYESATTGQGVYVFDPTLKPLLNADGNQGFKGGMTPTQKFTGTTTNSYDPRRIRISKDGRVFVTRQSVGVSPLFEINPADLNADFTPVFKDFAFNSENWELADADGNFMAAPNCGFALKGEGENLKVAMHSANKSGAAYAYGGFRCDEYDLGTATEWTTASSRKFDAISGKYAINYMGINLEYDNEGGIWFSQYRGTPKDTEPALVHVNAEGVEDYKNTTFVLRQGAIRYNHDFTKLAIADAPKMIGVYEVGKDAEGKPTLTRLYQFDTNIGSNCNDIAWDYAGNLWIVGNSSEYLKVFAMPRESGEVTTPSAATISVPSSSGVAAARNAAAKVAAGNGEIRIVGDAQSVEVYSITGTLVSKGETTIPCAKGVYIVKIDGVSVKVAVK